MISFRDCNSYLENLYRSPNVMDNIQTISTKEEIFSIDDIEFGVQRLAKVNLAKEIEGYQS
jgi:hypothetical protein